MGPLLAVHHAHGPDTLRVFDARVIIALYLSVHELHVRAGSALKSKRARQIGMHDRFTNDSNDVSLPG
jgi:hypothetical protein